MHVKDVQALLLSVTPVLKKAPGIKKAAVCAKIMQILVHIKHPTAD